MFQCSSKNLYKYSHLEGWSWIRRSFIPCVSENSKKGENCDVGNRLTCSLPRVDEDAERLDNRDTPPPLSCSIGVDDYRQNRFDTPPPPRARAD